MNQRALQVIALFLIIVLMVILGTFFSSGLAFHQTALAPTPTVVPTATPTPVPTPDLPPQLDFATSGWHAVLQKQGVTPAREGDSLLLGVIPGGKETVIYHACNSGESYQITVGSTIDGYVYCNTPLPGQMASEGSFDIAASRLSAASSYPVSVLSTGSETSYVLLIGQP